MSHNNQKTMPQLGKEDPLTTRVQQILETRNLNEQRALINTIIVERGATCLDYAAALLYICQHSQAPRPQFPAPRRSEKRTYPPISRQPGIKMVRYRLDIGSQHQITQEQLKKVLVEESGVDKNNINFVTIQDNYTIIELPDEMPQDIFQHLKTVEINQQKLDIKRLKTRNHKKRGITRNRRERDDKTRTTNDIAVQNNSPKVAQNSGS